MTSPRSSLGLRICGRLEMSLRWGIVKIGIERFSFVNFGGGGDVK
jgi:hypothetical protein